MVCETNKIRMIAEEKKKTLKRHHHDRKAWEREVPVKLDRERLEQESTERI